MKSHVKDRFLRVAPGRKEMATGSNPKPNRSTPPAKNMYHPWPSSPEATGVVELCTCTVGSTS